MRNFFEIIIEAIYWFGIFLSPTLFFGAIACFVYILDVNYFWVALTISFIGIITGFFWAERIRKKYGCTHYMGKILSTPDIWPDEPDNKKEKDVK